MRIVLVIAAAGFLGAVTRYEIGLLIPGPNGTGMPWATLIVNLSGSLLLGLLLGAAARRPIPMWLREAAGTGFLGAYTTFSAFNVQMAELARHQQWATAALYVALSGGAGWLLAAVGMRWGRGRAA